VVKGEGKGWSKGRKASDDPRIAKNAEAHRGKTYVPHLPPADDRRRRAAPASTEWTPTLAYAVGLLATDGCQTDGRHLAFPSADRELVEILLRCLGKTNRSGLSGPELAASSIEPRSEMLRSVAG